MLLTGAAGNLGRSIAAALSDEYLVVGLDLRRPDDADIPILEVDLTSRAALDQALERVRGEHGTQIASLIHLAAYFDFTGDEHPLYRRLNVEGTRELLDALQRQGFTVEQFLYASTMLVHRAARPGERIDETQPIEPGWAYPRSKAQAEAAIAEAHGAVPYVILRLAGIYDERSMVPTLAQQIARIHQRDFQSHLYSGATDAGQAMLHREDMIDAIVRTVERRRDIPSGTALLIGEPETLGYDALQDRIGCLVHGEADWRTLRVPAPVAAVGAWAQGAIEPLVPDALDQGEKPFIRPFMVRMASDHYALDVGRARALLGWRPRHRLRDVLPAIVANLARDPAAWYAANGLNAPPWLDEAQALGADAEALRRDAERQRLDEHRRYRWAHFLNIGLGLLLATQPPAIDTEPSWLAWGEVGLGIALMVFATLSLSWRLPWARVVCAGIGLLVMAMPFVLWSPTAAAYLADTLTGMLVIGLALGVRPDVGPGPVAATRGGEIPQGWTYNPSLWTQRLQVIALALVGLCISRYLAAYQLEHVDGVWEPFFPGDPDDPRNGTEEIITSSVAEAFPVPDAALGALLYALEAVTGVIGSTRRWRTMPWLVILFGVMIVPLGVVSIFFIIIQPIVIGTWSTLTLIGAAAMLVQIPYSLDELLASLQFLRRRRQAGRSLLRVLLFGDTDEAPGRPQPAATDAAPAPRPATMTHEFDRPVRAVLRDLLAGGVSLPWTLGVASLIGAALMFTRVAFGAEPPLAHADHVLGALCLTVIALAVAEPARALRFLLVPLGIAVAAAPFVFAGGEPASMVFNVVCGVALVALAFPRGPIRERYGRLDRLIR